MPTKRGDIEILYYNMILWLCSSLPWEKLLDPVTVQKEKEKAFTNMDDFLKKCDFHGSVPQAVHKFMSLLNGIKFNETPPYQKLRETLISGLKKLNHELDGKLKLDNISKSTTQPNPKSISQKIKKPIDTIRRSPRTKYIDASNSVRRNPRDSTVGVVMDRKRCNVKDIEQALEDMDSDCEYDIQILKKAKKAINNKIHKEDTISQENSKIEVITTKDTCKTRSCTYYFALILTRV